MVRMRSCGQMLELKSEVESSVPVQCALLSPLTVIVRDVICVLVYCCVPITSSQWGVTSAGRTAI